MVEEDFKVLINTWIKNSMDRILTRQDGYIWKLMKYFLAQWYTFPPKEMKQNIDKKKHLLVFITDDFHNFFTKTMRLIGLFILVLWQFFTIQSFHATERYLHVFRPHEKSVIVKIFEKHSDNTDNLNPFNRFNRFFFNTIVSFTFNFHFLLLLFIRWTKILNYSGHCTMHTYCT